MSDPKFVMLVPSGSFAAVRFSIPHGKGQRYDNVKVPTDQLLRFADAYRGCLRAAHCAHESPHSAAHATWHANNPESPIPCTDQFSTGNPDLAQLARNYLGAIDKLSQLAARMSEHPEYDYRRDIEIYTRHRDDALGAMRKACE